MRLSMGRAVALARALPIVLAAVSAAWSQSSPKALQFSAPCSFSYEDGSPYEQDVRPHVCDYIKTQDPQALSEFSSMAPAQQKTFLKNNTAQADQALQRYTDLLNRTQVDGGADGDPAAFAKLRSEKSDLDSQKDAAAAPFASNPEYANRFSARDNELSQALSRQQNDIGQKEQAQVSQASAKFQAGAAGATPEGGLSRASQSNSPQGNNVLFDNNAHGPSKGLSNDPNSRGLAQLEGSAAGNTGARSYTSYSLDHIRGADVPQDDAFGGPQKSLKDQWVDTFKEKEQYLHEYGEQEHLRADSLHDQADSEKAAKDRAASEAYAKGNYWEAAKAKAAGYADYTADKAGEYGARANAAIAAEGELGDRALQGDRVAAGTLVKHAAYGVAGVAAVAALPATLTVGGVAAATGAGLTAYGVTKGAGTVIGAQSWKEGGVGAAEIGVSLAAGPAAKAALGTSLGKSAVAAGETAVNWFKAAPAVEKGAVEVAGGLAAETATSATAHAAAHEFAEAAEHSGVEHVAHFATEQATEKAMSSGVHVVTGGEESEGHEAPEERGRIINVASRGAVPGE